MKDIGKIIESRIKYYQKIYNLSNEKLIKMASNYPIHIEYQEDFRRLCLLVNDSNKIIKELKHILYGDFSNES